TTTLILGYQNVNINNGGDADRWGAELEHFFPFSGDGGLKARAGGGKTVVSGEDDPTTWNIGATWYIGNNLGIRADFEKDDFKGFDVDVYGAGVEWFITENLAVEVDYNYIDPDDINRRDGTKLRSEYDEWGISALYRF
ncbi:MAG: porin, partial [Halioglobus sp.]|nr:porin [Halioglobus sp.]